MISVLRPLDPGPCQGPWQGSANLVSATPSAIVLRWESQRCITYREHVLPKIQ